MALKVAARFQRIADQASGARKDTRETMTVVNTLKGISPESKKDYVRTENLEDSVKPDRKDVRPEDVFRPTPNNVSVHNYVREGWPGESGDYQGMDKALRTQVPKDKGYDTVKNLSQYLLETEGGGGTPAVEK